MSSDKNGPATSSSPHPKRSFLQLLQIDAMQFGTDFCYATETAVVTPILLKLGLPTHLYSISWLLGPLLGCLLTPMLGPTSDRCRSSWGRRRPFILLLSVGVIAGMILYLNGGDIGKAVSSNKQDTLWSIILTMVGVVLVDFCADASDIPGRAYLIDVCNYDDVNTALNIRVVLAGVGGSLGYIFNAIDWMALPFGRVLGSQLRVICLFNVTFYTLGNLLTLCSIPEIPLKCSKDSSSSSSSSSTSPSSSSTSVSPGSLCCCCCGEEDVFDDVLYCDQDDSTESGFGNQGNNNSNDAGATNSGRIDDQNANREDPTVHTNDHQHLLSDCEQEEDSGIPPPERPIRRNAKFRHSRKEHKMRITEVRDGPPPEPCHLQFFPSPEERNTAADDISATRTHIVNEVLQSDDKSRRKRGKSLDDNFSNALENQARIGEGSIGAYDFDDQTDDDGSGSNRILGNNVGRIIRDMNRYERDNAHEDETSVTFNQAESHNNQGRRAHPTSPSSADGKAMNMKDLLKSFIFMPCVLRRLLFNHYVSWMAMLTVMLFFTDYMGQVVYKGDPDAPANSSALERYDKGVKMGCWGMCIYSSTAVLVGLLLSCMDKVLSLRTVYVFGQLIFAVGCGALVLLVDNVYATMSLCVTFGIHYAVIMKIPTNILAIYHESPSFTHPPGGMVRGLATDCGALGWIAFMSQITVSALLGPLVKVTGTQLTIVAFASLTGFLSSLLSACFISYEIR
ncbi:membrane-associated transporter protein-like [Diadema antillarum]|uniref:membrane-associated transporter protein-like n=1 Tax=Diadema antillarum TaxID=105358 RepID=UPI003A88FA22